MINVEELKAYKEKLMKNIDEHKNDNKEHIDTNKINNTVHSNLNNGAMQLNKNNIFCKRGEVFYSDLMGSLGSEQGGIRPVLIIQNDMGNKYSPTVIVAVLTSKTGKAKLPTHLDLNAEMLGLPKNSTVLFEQIRTLDKRRLREKIAILDELTMRRVDKLVDISMKNLPRKTTLERLPKEIKHYIVTKIECIEIYEKSIILYRRDGADERAIQFAEDMKFREENAIKCYCDKHEINYNEIYNNYKEIERRKEELVAL